MYWTVQYYNNLNTSMLLDAQISAARQRNEDVSRNQRAQLILENQIKYAAYAADAQRHRNANPGRIGGNVAIFYLEAPNPPVVASSLSLTNPSLHAEQIAGKNVLDIFDPKSVTFIFTEIEPCPPCWNYLDAKFPGVPVGWITGS